MGSALQQCIPAISTYSEVNTQGAKVIWWVWVLFFNTGLCTFHQDMNMIGESQSFQEFDFSYIGDLQLNCSHCLLQTNNDTGQYRLLKSSFCKCAWSKYKPDHLLTIMVLVKLSMCTAGERTFSKSCTLVEVSQSTFQSSRCYAKST